MQQIFTCCGSGCLVRDTTLPPHKVAYRQQVRGQHTRTSRLARSTKPCPPGYAGSTSLVMLCYIRGQYVQT